MGSNANTATLQDVQKSARDSPWCTMFVSFYSLRSCMFDDASTDAFVVCWPDFYNIFEDILCVVWRRLAIVIDKLRIVNFV